MLRVEQRVRRLLGAEALAGPRSRAAHCASTIWLPENDEEPMERTLPCRTRSVSAPSVSSTSVGRIGAVHLVEVDVVGAEPPQRVLDRPDDPAPRAAAPVRVLAHRHEELGRQHDVVAPALQRLPDDLLRLTV